MIDRLLLATVVVAHTLIAMAFALTDGPQMSPVIMRFTSEHGIHRSDVPIILLWAVGLTACGALAYRHRRTT